MAWAGGRGAFHAYGTYDGATVELEWSPDQSSNLDLGPEASLTAAGLRIFELPPGFIRAAVANAGTTSITATAITF